MHVCKHLRLMLGLQLGQGIHPASLIALYIQSINQLLFIGALVLFLNPCICGATYIHLPFLLCPPQKQLSSSCSCFISMRGPSFVLAVIFTKISYCENNVYVSYLNCSYTMDIYEYVYSILCQLIQISIFCLQLLSIANYPFLCLQN